MPQFSVVIPTYNRADRIVGTLDSVLSQDFDDFEVVLIDDGSLDNTEEVIREHYSGNPRVRYIKQANAERGAARNHGLREALAPYVLFFDSDDLMHRQHLSTLAAIIREHPGINFLATKYQIERDGRAHPSSLAPLKEGFYGLELFLPGNPLACNICVNKENPSLKLFEEDRSYAVFEDWMFMVENLAADRLYLSDRVTISLVDHAERSMRGDNREIVRKNRLARDWISERVPLNDEQKRILDGYSHYFCAIHCYLDNERTRSLDHLYKAARKIGLKPRVLALLVKTLIGRGMVQKAARLKRG